MPFSTICPLCGARYHLLDKFRNRKIVCDDCRRPFVAQPASAKAVEVPLGPPDRLPARGWLVVCPACAHAEVVAEGGGDNPHCSQCDSSLAFPVVASKKIRRRKGPRVRRRPGPPADEALSDQPETGEARGL